MFWLLIYPLYASYLCLRKPLKTEIMHWLVWFVAYEAIGILRLFIWWFPFFTIFEVCVLCGLYFPVFTSYFRKNVLFVTIKGFKSSIRYIIEEIRNVFIDKGGGIKWDIVQSKLKATLGEYFEYVVMIINKLKLAIV
jgi:hypothetical protein